MKVNTRMLGLFQATSEMFLILAVVGFAAAGIKATRQSDAVTRLGETRQHLNPPHPGTGGKIMITVQADAESVQVGGQETTIPELMHSKEAPDNVVLRLKGAQWRQISELVRSRDLRFTGRQIPNKAPLIENT